MSPNTTTTRAYRKGCSGLGQSLAQYQYWHCSLLDRRWNSDFLGKGLLLNKLLASKSNLTATRLATPRSPSQPLTKDYPFLPYHSPATLLYF
jgi:hypothetical protein